MNVKTFKIAFAAATFALSSTFSFVSAENQIATFDLSDTSASFTQAGKSAVNPLTPLDQELIQVLKNDHKSVALESTASLETETPETYFDIAANYVSSIVSKISGFYEDHKETFSKIAQDYKLKERALYCIEEGLALGAFGLTSVFLDPAAGNVAYQGTKTLTGLLKDILPEYEETILSAIKTVAIDPIVNYGPKIARSLYNVVSSALSGIASWWTGK